MVRAQKNLPTAHRRRGEAAVAEVVGGDQLELRSGRLQNVRLARFVSDVQPVAHEHRRAAEAAGETALPEFLPYCVEQHVSVIAGGPYNSGILAVGPRQGATFNYRAASVEMLDKAQRINAVCARYQVPLKAAALQFILAHPAIASVIPGARSVAEVEDNVRMVEWPIPADLWAALKQAGLMAEAAPTPNEPGGL